LDERATMPGLLLPRPPAFDLLSSFLKATIPVSIGGLVVLANEVVEGMGRRKAMAGPTTTAKRSSRLLLPPRTLMSCSLLKQIVASSEIQSNSAQGGGAVETRKETAEVRRSGKPPH